MGYISEGEGKFLNQTIILSFDVNNDKFGEIALPDGLEQPLQHLVVVKGNLVFVTLVYPETNFVRSYLQCFIGVMGEYGVPESWNKLFLVQL